jgi:hypothetical protein
MFTKYVRSHSGLFVMFSKRLGVQHVDMADHIADARSISDAGFVEIHSGEFVVYGKSITLGIACNDEAAREMNRALHAGEIRLYGYGPYADDGDMIATNAALPGNFEVLKEIEELRRLKIFE